MPSADAVDDGSAIGRTRLAARGSWLLLALLAAAGAYVVARYCALAPALGPDGAWAAVWRELAVPSQLPVFADLRTITNGTECWRRGIDVYVADPCDPWGRKTNYPPIWLAVFGLLGVDRGTTPYIGALFAASFAIAAVGYFGARRIGWHGVAYGLVMISAPIRLGIERGNSDLFIFALIVGGLCLAFGRRAAGAAASALFVLATALKLFPILAAAILLTRRKSAVAVALATGLAGAAYGLANLSYLAMVGANTIHGIGLAFGADVLFGGLADDYRWPALRALALPVLGAVGAAALACGLWLARRPAPILTLSGDRWGGGFATGAAIYLFSFAVAPSWDYRLCFLLLCVPQLLDWISDRAAPRLQRGIAGIALAALLAAAQLGPWSSLETLYIDELFNWLTFFLLAAILTANGWRTLIEARGAVATWRRRAARE
jgi:hypothetical protein